MRGGLAMAVPLVVSVLLHYPSGTWAAIAALNGIIADKGGSYRARATTIALATCAAAVVAALGTVAGEGHPSLVAPLVFLVALVAGLARALGAPGAAGVQVLVTFLVALAVPVAGPPGTVALERAGLVLLGGAWAMLLVLSLWPLRPYRPARLAVARCYRELAAFVEEIDRRIAAREPLTAGPLAEGAAAMRHAVEDAATVLTSTRRAHFAETGRGARLVQLHGIADRIFVHAVAVAETTDAAELRTREPAAQVLLSALLGDVAATLRAIGDATEEERSGPPRPVAWSGAPLRYRGQGGEGPAGEGPAGEGEVGVAHLAVLLDRMAQLAAAAAGAAAGLEGGQYGVEIPTGPLGAARGPFSAAASKIRAALAPGSLILRHALRVALVTTLAVVLTGLLGIPYGYWVSITVVVLLQPYTGMTTSRSVQRVVGAVIGGAIAAGLGALLREPVAITALIVVFVALSQAVFPVSYVVFSALVTPAFILLVELQTGDWGLAWVRVLNTVAGGALAFAAARTLWPLPEWNRLPVHMAAAVRAIEAYLRVVTGVLVDPDDAEVRPLAGARREIELAAINAEDSFQRLLGEDGGAPARLEAAMEILVSVRSLANAAAALALARHAGEPRRAQEVVAVTGVAAVALDDMADAILEARPPAPLPDPAAPPEPSVAPLMRSALIRLQRQLEALHHAVTRWTAPRAPEAAHASERSEPTRSMRPRSA